MSREVSAGHVVHRRNTCGDIVRSFSQEVSQETEEFKQAVDTFDKLYEEGEEQDKKPSGLDNNKKDLGCENESFDLEEQQSNQSEWKQVKISKSSEEAFECKSSESTSEIKSQCESSTKSSKKKRGRMQGNVEKSTSGTIAVDTDKLKQMEEAMLASGGITNEGFAEDNLKFSEVQKKITNKIHETQETVQSSLIDVESEGADERVRVQKHSLGVQGGVMVERTTTSTAHMVHTESTESYEENSMIDPDSLKNVDGPAKVCFKVGGNGIMINQRV